MMLCYGIRVAPSLVLEAVNYPTASVRMRSRNARMSRACFFEMQAAEECLQESFLPIARCLWLRRRWLEMVVIVVDIITRV